MSLNFRENFKELCAKGDHGVISDFILTEGEPVAYIKDDECYFSELSCSKQDFQSIAEEVLQPNNPELGEGNFDGSWVFGDWRFRVCGYKSMNKRGMVMRLLPAQILPIEKVGLPPETIESIGELKSGLILVCGATGSGKSTTIASVVDYIARLRRSHIVTMEDPVEYTPGIDSFSKITQRQIGSDVPSFSLALRASLRMKPNIICVGEIRDSDTAAIALEAANTGHLVFSTLHTSRAAESIDRYIKMLPPSTIHFNLPILGDCLQFVICQQLLRSKEGGRIALLEIYKKYEAATNYIKGHKISGLRDSINMGVSYGCLPMGHHLDELKRQDLLEDMSYQIQGERPR